MRRLFSFFLLGFFLLFNFANAAVLDDAITRAYTKKLTSYLNTSDFRPYQALRRDEAAKFFVNFAKLIGKTTYTVSREQCTFSDLDKGWKDLKETIIESCRLGIFKGNKGKFIPNGILTNAQAVAVLVRIVDWYQQESWLSHWAQKYYERATTLGVLNTVNLRDEEGLADRGNVLLLLYAARKLSGTNEIPVSPSPNTPPPAAKAPITINNTNTHLQGEELKLSTLIQEQVEKEVISLASAQLLTARDLTMLNNRITLHYTQWCENLWSGNTQIMTMTYGDTTTTSLQSLDLYFSLCEDTALQGIWTNALTNYAIWLTLHELAHYLYWIKDTKSEAFETICWKDGQHSCKTDDFISEYAQTDMYEDYAEHFAYWYVVYVQKTEPLRKPDNPNSVPFQAKMKYFDMTYPTAI